MNRMEHLFLDDAWVELVVMFAIFVAGFQHMILQGALL